MEAPAPRAARAFTLIELLAVLFIITLVLGITLPNLSLRSDRAVLDGAEDLAAHLSFARQRAVATGTTHRLVVDFEGSAYWIEAQPDPRDRTEAEAPAPSPTAQGAARTVQLSAPPAPSSDFAPLVGPFGRPHLMPDEVTLRSVETLAAGAVTSGQIALEFEPDGTADPARFTLQNEDGAAVEVEISRLADEVRIHRD